MDKIFKALVDKNRRMILTLLKSGEFNVTNLVKKLNVGQPTVSSHLAVLRKASLVNVETKSKERFYKLNYETLNGFVRELNRFLNQEKLIASGDEIILRRK